jgi:hypothetical protein
MLLTLLFFHLLAVAMLFAAVGIELAVYVALHRAHTVAQARAALSNGPLIGPIMGFGVLLLVAMGVAMVYVGGFGWQAWAIVVFIATIVLAVNGPLTNGKRGEALYRLAQNAPDGPITPELETARGDRVLNYSVFMTACELIAALYIMSNKPGLAGSLLTVAIAAVVVLAPMALVTRMKAASRSNVSP